MRSDAPVGSPEFGSVIPCPDCGELAAQHRRAMAYQRQRERIARYCPPLDGRQTFANFDPREKEGEATAPVRIALQAARQFARQPAGWLVLVGSNGVGKSHLARAIVHHLDADQSPGRQSAMIITAPDLLDLLRSGYDQGDYADLLDLCRQIDVLALDDLGTEKGTEWAREKLLQILDWRYRQRQPTVIVTNCRIRELEPRLGDRLACEDTSTVILMPAPSYRQRRRAKIVQ